MMRFAAIALAIICVAIQSVHAAEQENAPGWMAPHAPPSENECRSFIEKALKEQRDHPESNEGGGSGSEEKTPSQTEDTDKTQADETVESQDEGSIETANEVKSDETVEKSAEIAQQDDTDESKASTEEISPKEESTENVDKSAESQVDDTVSDTATEEIITATAEESAESELVEGEGKDTSLEGEEKPQSDEETKSMEKIDSVEEETTEKSAEVQEESELSDENNVEGIKEESVQEGESVESIEENNEQVNTDVSSNADEASKENTETKESEQDKSDTESTEHPEEAKESLETEDVKSTSDDQVDTQETIVQSESVEGNESAEISGENKSVPGELENKEEGSAQNDTSTEEVPSTEAASTDEGSTEEAEQPEEEELAIKIEIPVNLRARDHIFEMLKLDQDSLALESSMMKAEQSVLKELKKIYETSIKPLEILYKYRDLSNRHFGDPEIFSKSLVLFMGPWSGGKSTIINYLMDNEYTTSALRTGAEPSPAYFNIVMWGEREEILDGTQLAADWTFSGLQKFGQGLLDRLRGLKLNHPLLEKVNIIEIPGILEIRKQIERLFPFNDACQWFIDRADIIFLVYDPSKLDVGPETEAILDQLKGREYQTRIILNKADQVRPEELMRVQGTLIWNISPLMSSTEPPVMYTTSLWSNPYESHAPARLLFAQEKSFLKDLRDAIDRRVENKIASARRFAVRVRNHAKMVDCYLTTYYNHKSFFGNRKQISDDIIEHPQNYHIYEGLSTLTNISRYDLPDPDVYRDFFRLNPVYEFQQLSSTCTYFRGCPINQLDVAIAYELPELVGRYKRVVEDYAKAAAKKKAKP